jgi:hypothetical protein
MQIPMFASHAYAMQAPMLRIRGRFYTKLSPGGCLDVASVQAILEREGLQGDRFKSYW